MQRYTLLPGNLDVREQIDRFPPQIPNFTLEKLLLLIDLIYKQRGYNKWKVYDGHVQIMSRNFSAIADDYRPYLDYLIESKVVLCDGIARPAKDFPDDPKSFGYKFTGEYSLSFQRFDLETLKKNERRITRSRKKTTKLQTAENASESYTKLLSTYPFIKYLDKLDIDFDAATECLDLIQKSIILSNKSDEEKELGIYKLTSYLAVLQQFRNLASKKVSVDETGNRLHSPLTRMKKELRHFLGYKGQRLISLDIKNCQPFCSLVLFERSFWLPVIQTAVDGSTRKGKAILKSHKAKIIGLKDKNDVKGRLPQYLAVQDVNPTLAHELWGSIVDESSPDAPTELTLASAPEAGAGHTQGQGIKRKEEKKTRVRVETIIKVISADNVENQMIERFRNDVASGMLYERLIGSIESVIRDNPGSLSYLKSENIEWDETDKVRRKAAKDLMMRAMNARNHSTNLATRLAVEVLHNAYPAVYQLFYLIKRTGHRNMSRLLQRIESFLVLKACVKAINRQIKNVPLWTIHDSIITTESHASRVEAIMKDTVCKYIGVQPQISMESWSDYDPNGLAPFEDEPEDIEFSQEIM